MRRGEAEYQSTMTTYSNAAGGGERRMLQFSTPADAIGDAERLVAAEQAGRLCRTGNWSLGRALSHLAAWMDYAFDGYPIAAPPEGAARSRVLVPRILRHGMVPGVQLPGAPGGTVGGEDMPAAEGLTRLRHAWSRILKSCPANEHPFFGALSHEQWIALQLRHSELHQGFFHLADPAEPGSPSA